MSCIRYKFKSAIEYDKITFDGLQISVSDLRDKIMALKKMNNSDNFTLDIVDAQTKKMYTDDNVMIPRNSTVIVMRVPKHKSSKPQGKEPSLLQDNTLVSAEQLKKTGDLASANASEEDKVRAMISQAGEDYNPINYAKFRNKGAPTPSLKPPPANYVCHRCNQKGHWIKFCPTNGDPSYDNHRLKRSSGIPNSNLVAATSDVPGAMMDRYGNIVVRAVDLPVGNDLKWKNVPVAEPEEEKVPPELMCNICKELVRDAVIIPCCAESFCDECIRGYLIDNDFTCYSCNAVDVSPETLVPNKSLRAAVKNFQSRQNEKKSIAIARGLPSVAINNNKDVTVIDNTNSLNFVEPSVVQSSNVDTTTSELNTIVSSSNDKSPLTAPEISNTDSTPIPSPQTNLRQDHTPSPPPSLATSTASPISSNQVTTAITAPIMVPPPITHPTLITRPVLPPPAALFPQPPSILLPTFPLAAAAPTIPPPAIIANPFLAQQRISNVDPASASSMARLTELLMAAERQEDNHRSSSPPPLSMEDFYLQQKMLRDLASERRSKSRSLSHFSSYTSSTYSSSGSRSPSPYMRGRSRSPLYRSHRSTNKHHLQPEEDRSGRKKRKESAERESKHKHKHRKKKRKHNTQDSNAETTTEVVDTSEMNNDIEIPPDGGTNNVDDNTAATDSPSIRTDNSSQVDNEPSNIVRRKKRHKERKDGLDDDLRSTLVGKVKHHKHRHHLHHQDIDKSHKKKVKKSRT